MPERDPFTALCRQIANLQRPPRADLHIHTTHSDGSWSPQQAVDQALRLRLAALAITDHDDISAYPIALAHLRQQPHARLELITGVEITTEWQGREIHLLGYAFRPDAPGLHRTLADLRQQRRHRFREMAEVLRRRGMNLPAEAIERVLHQDSSPGRRHLAELLVRYRHASTIRDAFQRFLIHSEMHQIPKGRLPLELAIQQLHEAGGVSSLAHPCEQLSESVYHDLRSLGLDGIETEYPTARPGHRRRLRELASRLDLAISGGSDSHGPPPHHRAIGSTSIEMDRVRDLLKRVPCTASCALPESSTS